MVTAERRELRIMEGPQWDFVFSEARFPAMFSGTGGGKTIASVVKAFIYCDKYPKALGCLTQPTYKVIEDVTLPAIYDMWGETVGKAWTYHARETAIHFSNGSKILLRPADEADKLRGLTLAFFGMDEAAVGDEHETFKVLQSRLRQKGYPHQGWVTTTPKGIVGRAGWLYQRWIKNVLASGAMLSGNDYKVFRARTRDNHFLPSEYVSSLEESYGVDTKFFKQELEGEFVSFEGQAFPEFGEKHIRTFPLDPKIKRSVRGLDVGAVRPTSSHIANLMQDGRVWITGEFYERRCHERQLVEALSDSYKVLCDPSAKETIEMLRRAGINAKKAKSNDFKLRVRLAAARIALGPDGLPGMYIDPSCVNLINEYYTLNYAKVRGEDTNNDKWEPGADDHAHDDVAYSLMELDAGARGRPQPPIIVLPWGHN